MEKFEDSTAGVNPATAAETGPQPTAPTTLLKPAQKLRGKFQNPVPTTAGGASVIIKLLPEFFRNRRERLPETTPGPFRTDVSRYGDPPASGLRVTWFGHSSMLLEIDGVRILIDPIWDLRAAQVQWFGPKRFFPPTMRLEDLPHIDVVLLSHDHYDHLGAGTIRTLAAAQPTANARWITSLGVGSLLRKFGVNPAKITELDWTDSVSVSGADGGHCELTSLPSRHFSGRSTTDRFDRLWASFVLRGTEHNVYFGADSGWWEGYAEIGAKYGPFDLTMLEIGAFNELWKQIHLGPDNAARAFRELGGAGLLMPIHWGLFNLALHAWRQPIDRLLEIADADGLKIWTPEPGLPCEVVAGMELRSDWHQR